MKENEIITLGMLPTITGKMHQQSRILDVGGGISHSDSERLQRPTQNIVKSETQNNIIVIGILDETGYESNNRVYSIQGVSPVISARDYKDAKKILIGANK